MHANDLFLPPGYVRNVANTPFFDVPSSWRYQPHVYGLARMMVDRGEVRHVIDLGCGSGGKLAGLPAGTRVLAMDMHPDASALRATLGHLDISVQACDLEAGVPPLPDEMLADAVVICADVVEHLRDPRALLTGLARWARTCRYLLVSTPARDRARGAADAGPPANPAHCQEWTLDEFVRLARSVGLRVPLHGYTWNTDFHAWKSTIVVIDGREAVPAPAAASVQSAMPCAIVKSFNDEDFIAHCIASLRQQGLRVHLIDNWSTDHTLEIAEALARRDPHVTVERFPAEPQREYLWKALLERTVAVAEALGHGWYLHVDSDELRESPWPGIDVAQAVAHVDACGYSAIDFTVIDFRYLRGEALADAPWQAMRFFEFGRRGGHFRQVKAWKYSGQKVDLASSGGHDAAFEGRRIFPLKFLLRHYPLRGAAHAARKVFAERIERTHGERERYGWHTQYAGVSEDRLQGWSRHELVAWNPATFHSEFVVERLSGLGVAD